MALFIDPDECTACGVCEPECPREAIEEEDDVFVIDPDLFWRMDPADPHVNSLGFPDGETFSEGYDMDDAAVQDAIKAREDEERLEALAFERLETPDQLPPFAARSEQPRATIAEITKTGSDSPVQPETMVMTLNGIGVKPAVPRARTRFSRYAAPIAATRESRVGVRLLPTATMTSPSRSPARPGWPSGRSSTSWRRGRPSSG